MLAMLKNMPRLSENKKNMWVFLAPWVGQSGNEEKLQGEYKLR